MLASLVGLYFAGRSAFHSSGLPTKRLDVTVLLNAPLFSRSPVVADQRLRVAYGDSVLASPRQLLVKVRNSGGSAIRDRDIVDPLSISLGGSARVMGADIIARWPENLAATVVLRDSTLNVSWPLLNQRDSMLVGVIYDLARPVADTSLASVSAQARIEGLHDIDFHPEPPAGTDTPGSNIRILSLMIGFFAALLWGGGRVSRAWLERQTRRRVASKPTTRS